jgi:hypothetical protein
VRGFRYYVHAPFGFTFGCAETGCSFRADASLGTENVFRLQMHSFYSSRGGGVVNALASRSKFAQKRACAKTQTSQPVGLVLAGVRVPSPAPWLLLSASVLSVRAKNHFAVFGKVKNHSSEICVLG